MFCACRKSRAEQRQQGIAAMLQSIPPRVIEMQAQIRQLDEATQYRIARESAQRVGRTDEACIQDLIREGRGD